MAADIEVDRRHAGYSRAEPTQPPNWHGLVSLDLLFNNLATGLFLAAAVAELARPSLFGSIGRIAYPIALGLLLVDLACLVFDLGSPTKFHHMLRVFKPSSPMSLGTWCLTVYSLPLTVVAAIDVLTYLGVLSRTSSFLGWVHWLGLIAGSSPALGSAAYKGVLFSTSSQPGWKDARWLGAYLVNSALMLGTAGLLTIASLANDLRATSTLRPPMIVMLVLNLAFLGLLAQGLGDGMDRAFDPPRRRRMAAGAVVNGCVVPMGLVMILPSVGWPAMVAALVALLVASFSIRSSLVKLPHLVRGPDHLSSEA